METVRTVLPLVVGSYGLTLSSYLIYENWKKGKWEKTNGYIENVTLKCSRNFFQGAYYLNIKYYFYVNNEIVQSNKEYKIYVSISRNNKQCKNVEVNEYTQNIFDQASKEKDISISYDPYNIKHSEPLIYIYENDVISKYKLLNKLKSWLVGIKKKLSNLTGLSRPTGNNFLNKEKQNKLELDQNKEAKKENVDMHNDPENLEHIHKNSTYNNRRAPTFCCSFSDSQKRKNGENGKNGKTEKRKNGKTEKTKKTKKIILDISTWSHKREFVRHVRVHVNVISPASVTTQ
ncbi:hypothetical protein MKS88_001906 [Plasmodium brasilianum]|uniref:Uncharacterized protein n=1 Tax=Plasmodium brasilianum TaxID=5824 RepID=A0ACB9YDM6_PLABR|nr:hypothetical protein MKS88_001906 [Plasmodium brasilianum]